MKLLVSVRAYREKFTEEKFCTTDDIFALVQSGKFLYEIDGKSYIITENEGALFPKNVPGFKRVIEPLVMFLFRYKNDTPLFAHKKIKFEDTTRIQSTLNMLQQAENSPDADAFEYKLSLFNDIVTQYRLQNKAKSNINDVIIANAVHLIQQKCHSKLHLPTIAKLYNLSYPQFIRRFKKAMNMPPSDYVTMLRLSKAKSLLLSSNLHIREISELCGFENEYYFSKFFKTHVGMPPSEFRKTKI